MQLPRISPRIYQILTLAALATLTIIIVTGAAVRLTGSGLGCTDWPGCEQQQFFGELEGHKAIEQLNRYFTGACGVAAGLAVLGSLIRRPRRRDLTVLSLSLVVGIIGQAVLGGITVWKGLSPPYVMAHFLLSIVIIWAAYSLHYRAKQPAGKPHPQMASGFIWLIRGLAVLTFVVFFIGTMVTGSGPHGGDENVERLGFSPHDITRVHGAFVWLLIALTAFTMWRMHAADASRKILKAAEFFMVTLLVQGAIGYFQYSLGVPAILVLVHVAGAVLVWFAVLRLNFVLFERWGDVGLPAFDGDVDTSDLTTAFVGEGPADREPAR